MEASSSAQQYQPYGPGINPAAGLNLEPGSPPAPRNIVEVIRTWDNPHYFTTVAAGSSALMAQQFAFGADGPGYLTLEAVLWIPAGPNGTSFFYQMMLDGLIVDKIFRVIGAGSSVSQTTGVPSPLRIDPPLSFNRELDLICYNQDTVPHFAEVYVGGYTKLRIPAAKYYGPEQYYGIQTPQQLAYG